ncbi:DNA polymerase III subunit chi [Francisellaceae bacterium]|nr:DNA polymerase III subunit chi [Francisellaceae bacterium]
MKIQFYILNTDEPEKISNFVCQLVEKIFNKNHRIQIRLNSEQQLKDYDDALWSYKISESFLAHLPESEIEDTEGKVPIVLSYNPDFIMEQPDILVSLNITHSTNNQFKQALFVVNSNNKTVNQARELYKTFTSQNYELVTHKISL